MIFSARVKGGQKKWRLEILSSPAILNSVLSLKTQNFAVKSNSENRFTFIQKISEWTDFCNHRDFSVIYILL